MYNVDGSLFCELLTEKAHAFDLTLSYPGEQYVTFSKKPKTMEKIVDRTCEGAASRINTLKSYLESEKNYLGEEEETNKDQKAELTTDDKRIKQLQKEARKEKDQATHWESKYNNCVNNEEYQHDTQS